MNLYINDNQLKDDNFLKAIDQSYDTLHKQILRKKAALYMIVSWQEMYNSTLSNIDEINKEYLFTEEELNKIFHVRPDHRKHFSTILNKYAPNTIIYIHRTHYYSLPKIIASYWVLERIVPLTFFWHEGEFDKEEKFAYA